MSIKIKNYTTLNEATIAEVIDTETGVCYIMCKSTDGYIVFNPLINTKGNTKIDLVNWKEDRVEKWVNIGK